MGRGAGGVAQTKGKSLSAVEAQAASGYSFRQIRKAVEEGKSTENAEKAYAKQLRKFPLDVLERRQERDLYNAFMLDGKRSEVAKVSYQAYDKLELLERQELMRRDPEKYNPDWVANAFAKARKKAGK